MSDMELLAQQKELYRRLRRQEAKALGPTVGEVFGMYLGIPNLRGFWPFSSLDNGGNAYDQSGQARTLTLTAGGSSAVLNDLIGYFDFNGTTGYQSRADEAGLEFSGNLTFGGWFRADALTAIMQVIGKSDVTLANDSYRLSWRGDLSGDPVQFSISDGVAVVTAGQSGTGDEITVVDQWYFIAGRFTSSTEVALFISDGAAPTLSKYVNTTSVPAAVVNGTSAFRIGASGAASRFLDGGACLCFLCARNLADSYLEMLYQRSRVLFSV